jgi:hypothetical protein
MSFGYCGNNTSVVSANLRIDGSGIRFHAAADVAVSIAAGDTKLVTFSVIVPKNVGFATIPWNTLITGSGVTQQVVDYVGWIADGNIVSESTETTTSLWSSSASVMAADDIDSDPIETLFYKFQVKFVLNNTNTKDTFSAQKLIVGFTYNVAPPNTGQAKFDIYASVAITD